MAVALHDIQNIIGQAVKIVGDPDFSFKYAWHTAWRFRDGRRTNLRHYRIPGHDEDRRTLARLS